PPSPPSAWTRWCCCAGASSCWPACTPAAACCWAWRRCGRACACSAPAPARAEAKENPPRGRVFRRSCSPGGLLDLAFLVDHVLANDGIVLLDLHLVRRGLLVLVGGVEVAGAGRGDQADLVALGCHGSVLLRSSRRGHAARPGRRRCPSCRWCEGRRWKRAASPNGSPRPPRSGAHAGWEGNGGGSCCWRARRCYRSARPCR